jgi:hypothetical protein
MNWFRKKSKVESWQEFYDVIQKEYIKITVGKVDPSLIDNVSKVITDFYHNQYTRFYKEYPKSAKQYLSFQLKDLDHPNTGEKIIDALKKIDPEHYAELAGHFMKMTQAEVLAFEKNREEFYKMF